MPLEAGAEDAYRDKCRDRIIRKLRTDLDLLTQAHGRAKNIGSAARCHFMYFDVADEPAYAPGEDLIEDIRERVGFDPTRLGDWSIFISYAHAHPQLAPS